MEHPIQPLQNEVLSTFREPVFPGKIVDVSPRRVRRRLGRKTLILGGGVQEIYVVKLNFNSNRLAYGGDVDQDL